MAGIFKNIKSGDSDSKKILNKSKGEEELDTLVNWYDNFIDVTRASRSLAERDIDYYDGKQWTSDELSALEERGQPPVTINLSAKQINFILGNEVRTRVDPKALPRTMAGEKDAQVASDVIRYVAEKEQFGQITSSVFRDMVVPGYGACFVGVTLVDSPTPSAGKLAGMGGPDKDVEVSLSYIPWDRIFYDPHSSKADFSDALYTGIVVWMDLDDAKKKYPDKAAELEGAAQPVLDDETHEDKPRYVWADRDRERVRVCEIYYKKDGHFWLAHYTKGAMLLEPRRTGFIDEKGVNQSPLVMMSCYVDRDNNRYGVMRSMVSPQDEVNKRRSKALHFMTTRQIMAEESAVRDPYEARAQLARPDGYIEVRDGTMQGGGIQVLQTSDLSQAHFQMMQQAIGELSSLGPDKQELLQGANASGAALRQRMNLASLELAPIRDRLRSFQKSVYRQIWYRARQFWTTERYVRVRDDESRAGFKFIGLNREVTKIQKVQELMADNANLQQALSGAMADDVVPLIQQFVQSNPDLQQADPGQVEQVIIQFISQLPEMNEIIKENDIAQLGVDIVLTETPDTAVVQQEVFEQLVALASSGQLQVPPDVLLEMAPIPNKERILARLNPEPTQEQQQLQAQQQQLQQQQLQLQLAALQAQVEKIQADTQRAMALANKDNTQAALNVEELNLSEAKEAKMLADIEKTQVSTQVEAAFVGPKSRLMEAEAAEEATRAQRQQMENELGISNLFRGA